MFELSALNNEIAAYEEMHGLKLGLRDLKAGAQLAVTLKKTIRTRRTICVQSFPFQMAYQFTLFVL